MTKILIVLSLAAVGLSACTTLDTESEQQSATATQALEAFVWSIERVQQPAADAADPKEASARLSPPAAVAPFELQFEDGRVAVLGLCNVLSGAYQVEGGQIEVQPMMSTRKMCANEQLMATENFVGQALPTASRWQLEELEAQSWAQSTPSLTLEFEAGMRWQLQGTPTPQTQYGQAGEQVFLEIDGQDSYCAAAEHACYRVRSVTYNEQGIKTGTGAWEQIDKDQLHDFEAQTGAMTIIRAQRFEPQGQSEDRPVYVYDMTVESHMPQ